jgi:hypothetical protein
MRPSKNSNINYLESSILNDTNIECSSGNSNTSEHNLFDNQIPEYDEKKGFYEIKNPGWIKFSFKNPIQISYLRFLLWDNRGSDAKRQPSNRKYTYRVLIAECKHNPTDANGIRAEHGIVWTAIYENSINPSNGWQEFYFEDGVKEISAIKLEFFQNTSASNTHKNYTQLVSVQAYRNPTLAIHQLLKEDCANDNIDSFAPQPSYGFIRNRVIVGGLQEEVNSAIEDEIIHEIKEYITNYNHASEELQQLRYDLINSSKDNMSKNDIEKQIHIFNKSILKPIEEYDKKLSHDFRAYTYIAMGLFLLGIIKDIYEILCLCFGWNFYLSADVWLKPILQSIFV